MSSHPPHRGVVAVRCQERRLLLNVGQGLNDHPCPLCHTLNESCVAAFINDTGGPRTWPSGGLRSKIARRMAMYVTSDFHSTEYTGAREGSGMHTLSPIIPVLPWLEETTGRALLHLFLFVSPRTLSLSKPPWDRLPQKDLTPYPPLFPVGTACGLMGLASSVSFSSQEYRAE